MLTVTPSDYSLDGAQYRVSTWKPTHQCKTFSFPPAGLVMLPERTITISPTSIDLSETDSPTTFSIVLVSKYYKSLDDEYRPEYNTLLLIVLLGMFLMTSSINLVIGNGELFFLASSIAIFRSFLIQSTAKP